MQKALVKIPIVLGVGVGEFTFKVKLNFKAHILLYLSLSTFSRVPKCNT